MSTNPNVVILDRAWALLWNTSSRYYLPGILADGGTFGSTVIPPMASVELGDIDPIPLYNSDVWGNVAIVLSSMTLDGLPTIGDLSFTPSSDAASVSATVAFGLLTFAGSYQVDGTGLVGCAMDIAEGLACQDSPPARDEDSGVARLTAPIPPEHMDLARSYRDKLVQSPNGTELVSKYYDHNDTVNLILNQENAFTQAWPYNAPVNPPDLDTAYYMQVTANATAHPDDPDYTVGGNDDGYLSHSAYMQATLIGTCHHYAEHDPDRAHEYLALSGDAAAFRGYTNKYPDPMTAASVLSTVVNAQPMSQAELAAVPEPEAVRLGREAAERDFDQLHARAMARRAARMQQVTTYQSKGAFRFSFPMPTLTFTGTVAVSGIPPRQELTVTLTSLSAAVPDVGIELLAGTDPSFTADAQAKINDSQWFQQVLGTKVNAKIGSRQVREYLSHLLNQAILGALKG